VYRTSYRNIQPSLTSAVPASEFQSKVIFDDIEKRLKEVEFFSLSVCRPCILLETRYRPIAEMICQSNQYGALP